MKIKNKSTIKPYVIALSVIAVIGLIVVVWLLFFRDPTQRFEPKYQQSTDEIERSDTGSVKSPNSDNNIIPSTSEEVPVASSGSITINDLEQSAGFVNVAVNVSSFDTSRCVYSFTSDGAKPVVRELKSCENLSIPEIEFEKIGTYTLTVTAYGDNSKIDATRDINIR